MTGVDFRNSRLTSQFPSLAARVGITASGVRSVGVTFKSRGRAAAGARHLMWSRESGLSWSSAVVLCVAGPPIQITAGCWAALVFLFAHCSGCVGCGCGVWWHWQRLSGEYEHVLAGLLGGAVPC